MAELRTAYVITQMGERGGVASHEVTLDVYNKVLDTIANEVRGGGNIKDGLGIVLNTINPIGSALLLVSPGQCLRFEMRENVAP